MAQPKKLDPCEKADIYRGILALAEKGQVKRCTHLLLSSNVVYYTVFCERKFAYSVETAEVDPPPSINLQRHPYRWPRCPEECPGFEASPNFGHQMRLDEHEREVEAASQRAQANQIAETMHRKQVPLAKPTKEQVTLHWLGENVPLGFWLKAATAFLFSFLLGAYFSMPIQYFVEQSVAAIAAVKKLLSP